MYTERDHRIELSPLNNMPKDPLDLYARARNRIRCAHEMMIIYWVEVMKRIDSEDYTQRNWTIEELTLNSTKTAISNTARYLIRAALGTNRVNTLKNQVALFYLFAGPPCEGNFHLNMTMSFTWATNIKIDFTMRGGEFTAKVAGKELISNMKSKEEIDMILTRECS